MKNYNVQNYLNKNSKNGAFRTSFLEIDPNLWLPEFFYKLDNGYYSFDSKANANCVGELGGKSRTSKRWFLNDLGEKIALYGDNFEKYEHILNIIYCGIADIAKVPCMSSVPVETEEIFNSESYKKIGLLSLNVCTQKVEKLLDFENNSFEANYTKYSVKNLKNKVLEFADKNGMSVDDDFESDLLKLILLDYCTCNCDKRNYSNYSGAIIKNTDGSKMISIAPAMDNGLCFGVMSQSRWLVSQPERVIEAKNNIDKFLLQKENYKADEVFYNEFGKVLPIMPYRTSYDYQCVRFSSKKWGKHLLTEPVMQDLIFKEQMSVAMLENPEVLKAFQNIKNIKFEDVKSLLSERFENFNIDDKIYNLCESLFNYRVLSLNNHFEMMKNYKDKNPDDYNEYLKGLIGPGEITDYKVRIPDVRENPKKYGGQDYDFQRDTDYINPNAIQ